MSVYAIRDTGSGYAVVRWLDGWGREVEIIRMFPTGNAGIRDAVRLCRACNVSPEVASDSTPGPSDAPAGPPPAVGASCAACGAPLPERRTRPRRYCSAACRVRQHRTVAA